MAEGDAGSDDVDKVLDGGGGAVREENYGVLVVLSREKRV